MLDGERGGRVSVCPRKWGSRCPVLGGMTIFTIWHVILQSSDGRQWHLLGKYFLSISRSHSSIILLSNKRPSWGGWHQHCHCYGIFYIMVNGNACCFVDSTEILRMIKVFVLFLFNYYTAYLMFLTSLGFLNNSRAMFRGNN